MQIMQIKQIMQNEKKGLSNQLKLHEFVILKRISLFYIKTFIF